MGTAKAWPMDEGNTRRFLLLQEPHGPFYAVLSRALRRAGAEVFRVGFNGGDALFGRRDPGFIPYLDAPEDWRARLSDIVEAHAITDIVVYGASRPVHVVASDVARDLGLVLHVFEEGYLRPYWVTYEREGANAGSALMDIPISGMERALEGGRDALHEAPDSWGDMRQHMFWGAVYHAALMISRRHFPGFRPHRTPGVEREFRLHLRRLLALPLRRVQRAIATTRVRRGAFPFHVVLLQLAHDANFRDFSGFESQRAFLEPVFAAFARGAPRHHALVLKAHPLEDGREPLKPLISELTQANGLEGRVHFLSGGKLARLLETARSAVTVNSTSAEQALWRGLPVRALGRAVYARENLVSDQALAAFFANPEPPDRAAYETYRSFLLQTSQIAGGFYSARGRRKLARQLPDLMLARLSPYEMALSGPATTRQHIRLVT